MKIKNKNQSHRILNKILNTMENIGETDPIEYNDVFYNSGVKLSNRDKKIVIDKLIQDNYLSTTQVVTKTPNYTGYFISFNGLLFIEKGGYIKELRVAKIKDCLNWLTIILAPIASIIVIIYSMCEIFGK